MSAGQEAQDEMREHAHRTREARDECERGRCDGDVRYDSKPFDNAPPQGARDDEREALINRMRRASTAIYFATEAVVANDISAMLRTAADLLSRKHPEPEITDAFRAYVDRLGVDANEEHDGDEWWSGYRQAQRDNIARATAALQTPVGEGERS